MKFIELKKNLSSEIKPAYLIFGKDSYLKKNAQDTLMSTVVKENYELNSVIFSTDKLEPEKVVEACNTMPFFAEKKLVLVKEYEKKKSDALVTALGEYLKAPNPSTCLVLVAEDKSKYFDSLKKQVELIDCNYLSNVTLTKWISAKLTEQNASMENRAVNALIDYCNFDLARISMELMKLVSYVEPGEGITFKDVNKNVSKDLDFQIYELTGALSLKKSKEAFIILETLLASKSVPSAILASIYRHFRRLFHISLSKKHNAELASELGVKEYAVIKGISQAKSFGARKLKTINELCVDIDFKSKTGKMDALKGLNYLVLSILNM